MTSKPSMDLRLLLQRILIMPTIFLVATVVCAQPKSDVDEDASLGGQQFGDWVVRCTTSDKGVGTCVMSQLALAEESAETLLKTNIAYHFNQDTYDLQFRLPLGISLRKPLSLNLDRKSALLVPIDICLPDGCYSITKINDEMLEKILRMQAGEIRLSTGSGNDVSLPISGRGSRAAFNAMKVMAQKMDERVP